MGATTKLVTTHEVGVQLGPGSTSRDLQLRGSEPRWRDWQQARYGVGFACGRFLRGHASDAQRYRFDEGAEVAGEEFLRGEFRSTSSTEPAPGARCKEAAMRRVDGSLCYLSPAPPRRAGGHLPDPPGTSSQVEFVSKAPWRR